MRPSRDFSTSYGEIMPSNGESFTENFEITFAEEGVAATGKLSITGMGGGQNCSSTFNVTATRM